ncbi:MAG TPA: LytTR family DNA-binding domain-containing protein [Flavobacteriaceae bacterium]|nr:LytTR family DNA-binding domain-containing protein [Flavobacteriaceae bacterium]
MNVVIIEDEKPSARRLQRLLEKEKLNVLQLLHSVREAVEWFKSNPQPDLIFLDIQLSDGLSFEIFEQIDLKSAIIFTTAYDEYALKAFKLNSVDYLLKPIDEEELLRAIEKYKNRIFETPINLKDIHRFLDTENTNKSFKTRFSIKVGQHLKVFSAEEIACFYSENKGTYLNTIDNRNYLMETTLENLELEVSPEQFFRANRKFLINLAAIQDIISYSNSRLKIRLKEFKDAEIIVSRERVRDFKNWLG